MLAVLGTVALCVFSITGYFRLSSDTATLQSSLVKSVGGQWDKKVAIRVGWLTMGLVRTGLRFIHLDPEPRAAIEALRGVEVGVYNQAPGARCQGSAAERDYADYESSPGADGWAEYGLEDGGTGAGADGCQC